MFHRGILLILLCIVALPAAAQEPDPNATPSSPDDLVPPSLIEYVEATYPEEARKKGVQAQVLAQISVDETGVVTGVAVVESAGKSFDDAAKEAMYQFLFTPATKGGEPVPSKVLYRYTFFLTPEAVPPDEVTEPLPAVLKGVVRDMDGQPVPGSVVLLVAADGSAQENSAGLRAVADDSGAFAFDSLPAGAWQLDIVAPGYQPLSSQEILEEGELREVLLRLDEETSDYETVVRARKPPREVTRREITRREITRIPGTGGDALRSVQNLPGMSRAPAFSGQLLVRGSAPEDSKYFFDQMPIPMLYHFGGLTSVINSDLLDRIDFYPGNYSVRYGGATGGIVDVYPRAPATDRFHGYVDADLWDASVLVETPIGDKWSIAVSARRSYIDAILNAVMPEEGGFQFTVAPRYWDYQLVADYHPHHRDNLRLFVFGSDDKAIFLFGNQVVGNPTFTGGITFHTLFHQAQLRWEHRFNRHLTNEANIGFGYQESDSAVGDLFRFDTWGVPVFVRDEFEWTAARQFILRIGVDTQMYGSKWNIVSATALPTEGQPMDPIVAGGEPFTSDGSGWFMWPALYAEGEVIPLPDLRIIPGLRLAWFDQIHRFGFDPRLVVRWKLLRHTTAKAGVGLFHQAPNTAVSDPEFGNPDLKLTKAVHYSAGLEHEISPVIDIGMEGFYKQIFDLVVPGESGDSQILGGGALQGPRYTNEGKGTVYGFELLLRHRPTDRFFGWVSYTFMQSTRIDRAGEPRRPFDFDQTHILTVVANLVLGRGWEAGVRFRLVTGNPDTPVTGAVFDADSDSYWPVYGPVNSDRLPAFHQLDVRVDKIWTFKHLQYSVYVDVQNVYNHKNVEGYDYAYDYSDKVYFYGLPILPSVGMKLEY